MMMGRDFIVNGQGIYDKRSNIFIMTGWDFIMKGRDF